MSVLGSHYNSDSMNRKSGPNWYKDSGCHHQPKFNIPPEDVIIDELHLMLRVTDMVSFWKSLTGMRFVIIFTMGWFLKQRCISNLIIIIIVISLSCTTYWYYSSKHSNHWSNSI